MPTKLFWRRLVVAIGIAALSFIAAPTAPTASATEVHVLTQREYPLAGKFIPPHTRGDREFKGHGPTVTVEARLEVRGARNLFLQICMKAEETTSDWTTAEGCTLWTQIYQSNIGTCITHIGANLVDTLHYTDTDTSDDVFGWQTPDSFIERWTVTGDTSGSEAGTRTGVLVRNRGIQVTSEFC